MPCDSGRPTVAMTIGNLHPGMGNITDPLCHSSICDLEQKLCICMWKSYRVSTGKNSLGCFLVFWFFFRGGVWVGRVVCVCVAFVCVILFFFSLCRYRSYIFLERNILSAVLCSEDGKPLETMLIAILNNKLSSYILPDSL